MHQNPNFCTNKMTLLSSYTESIFFANQRPQHKLSTSNHITKFIVITHHSGAKSTVCNYKYQIYV